MLSAEEGLQRQLEEIQERIRKKVSEKANVSMRKEETEYITLSEEVSHLKAREKRLLEEIRNGNGRDYCEIGAFFVSCPGECDDEEECNGKCEKSYSRYGKILLKEDVFSSVCEPELLVIDKESRIGKRIDEIDVGAIIIYRDEKKHSIRIDSKRYFE